MMRTLVAGIIALVAAAAPCAATRIVEDDGRHWFEDARGDRFVALGAAGGLERIATVTLSFAPSGENACLAALRPDFEARVAEAVAQVPDENIGIYLGDEMPWYGVHAWPGDSQNTLLEQALLLSGDDPARASAIEFLAERCDSIGGFNTAWNCSVESWSEVDFRLLRFRQTDAAASDRAAFTAMVAERFFETAARVIRAQRPDALLLGTRFAQSAPEEVIRACGRACDAISYSEYRFTDPPTPSDELLARAWVWSGGRPIIISGFGWRVRSSDEWPEGLGGVVGSPADRAANCAAYLDNLFEWPMVVGASWDQARTGASDEALACALVGARGRANAIHASSERAAPTVIPSLRAVSYVIELASVRPTALELLDETPIASPEVFGPATSSFRLHRGDRALDVDLDTGTGQWGGGIVLHGPERLACGRGLATDLRGYADLVIEGTLPASLEFRVTLDEARLDAPAARYEPLMGADDGESFVWEDLRGTGAPAIYRLPLGEFGRRTDWGNQHGLRRIDMQSMKGIALHFPQGQGTGHITLTSVRLERGERRNTSEGEMP